MGYANGYDAGYHDALGDLPSLVGREPLVDQFLKKYGGSGDITPDNPKVKEIVDAKVRSLVFDEFLADGAFGGTDEHWELVRSVADSAFAGCTTLASVMLPAAVSIGSGSFSSCTALVSVSLPSATSIGTNAFSGCTSLESVDLGSYVAGGPDPEATARTLCAGWGITRAMCRVHFADVDIVILPTSGFYVNGTAYTTFADAVAALRAKDEATLEMFEDVEITTTENYPPEGSQNVAGLTFANQKGFELQMCNFTVDGHGHSIKFSTFAADGILIAGFGAGPEYPKNQLIVTFKNLDVVCSDANVFRAFQCSNAIVHFENVTANSKRKNIIGINGAVVTIDGATLTYDGGWEPIGVDNGAGADGASCTFNSGSVTGLPSNKAFANVELSNGTQSGLVIKDGAFDTLPAISEDHPGGTIAISGGRFKVAVPQNLCAEGYVPHDYDDGEYRYGVIEG